MLTGHARQKVEGTVSVLTGRVVVEALRQRNLDADPVLRRAGLSRESLDSCDNRVPFESVVRLWELAAEAAKDPSLGAHVAETLPAGAYDVIDYILSTSKTVGESFARFTHYARIIYDRTNVKLTVEPPQARIVRNFPQPCTPQYEEFTMTFILSRSRQSCGVDWKPNRMVFRHERSGDASELTRIFGCPISFGAEATELQFDASILELPHKHPDSRLLDILTRYADSLLNALPKQGDLVASVSSTIAHRMATEIPTLTSTAASIRYPARTLQRRLSAEGITHSTLVDHVRRGLALKYIGDAGLSLGEIAYLLHFGDTTAFHRAFKRWTGDAPKQYRRRLFDHPAA